MFNIDVLKYGSSISKYLNRDLLRDLYQLCLFWGLNWCCPIFQIYPNNALWSLQWSLNLNSKACCIGNRQLSIATEHIENVQPF